MIHFYFINGWRGLAYLRFDFVTKALHKKSINE